MLGRYSRLIIGFLPILFVTTYLQAQKGHYAPKIATARSSTGSKQASAAAVPVRDFDARIYLYAFGTGGYGYPARSLLNGSGVSVDAQGNGYILSNKNGEFDLTGLYANACTPTNPDGSEQPDVNVYLVATDGATVAGPNPLNVTAAAMPVLCSELPNVATVVVNELTTVAAAYELSSYATVSLEAFSSDATQQDAVNAAFAYANSLVDSTTGVFTSAVSSNYPAIVQQFDTIADILAACVDSDINTSNTCLNIAAAATPPGGVAPTDTFQAALDIALNPGNNVQSLYSFASPNAPYQPILSQAPTTWALTLSPNNPVITSVSPTPGQPGGQVTISGTGFGPSSSQPGSFVVVGGVQAGGGSVPVISWSDSAIILAVPLDAASGVVQVSSPNGVTPPFPYLVTQPGQASVPQIDSLSFQQGPETMGLTINAAPNISFGNDPGSTPGNQVTIGGPPYTPLVMPVIPGGWTPTAITVQVPVGAFSGGVFPGNITVTVRGQTSFSAPFTVLGDLIPCPPGQSTPSNPPQ